MSASANDVPALERALHGLAERARRARLRRSEREYPPIEEVQPVLAALVRAYGQAGEAERERMRETWRGVLDAQTWMLWLASEWARNGEAVEGLARFEDALRALSLEDAELDTEETQLVLGIVWHRARRAAVDLRPAIERVVGLSSSRASGLASMLLAFESSPFFAEVVAVHFGSERLPFEASA